jgi:hypothetical protein
VPRHFAPTVRQLPPIRSARHALPVLRPASLGCEHCGDRIYPSLIPGLWRSVSRHDEAAKAAPFPLDPNAKRRFPGRAAGCRPYLVRLSSTRSTEE